MALSVMLTFAKWTGALVADESESAVVFGGQDCAFVGWRGVVGCGAVDWLAARNLVRLVIALVRVRLSD